MSDDERESRILEARLRLRERFLERMRATPAQADEGPRGSGPGNRHGMPRLPPGQYETAKWPVLDLGKQPAVAPDAWQLVVDGAVERPVTLDWGAFLALEQVVDESDFHCVTTWSRFDLRWEGVRLETVLSLAEPTADAAFVLVHSYDGYTTNLPLEEALKADVLLAHRVDGAPLERAHGGPVRLVVPQLYAWKAAKWVRRLQLLREDRPGFWERRGYSNSAHPWREDRYSDPSSPPPGALDPPPED